MSPDTDTDETADSKATPQEDPPPRTVVLGPKREPSRFEMGASEGPDGEESWEFRVQGSETLGDPSPDLIKKICQARIAIAEKGPVPRSGYNSRIDHEYSTYDDINGHVAVPLAQAEIWVESSMVETYKQPSGKSRNDNQKWNVTAVMEVYITDGDTRTGRMVIGENDNTGDKHHYALESQLLRYALSKMLLLETGDPEVDQDHPVDEGAQTQQDAQARDTGREGSAGATTEVWIFEPDNGLTDSEQKRLTQLGWTPIDGRDEWRAKLSPQEAIQHKSRLEALGDVTKEDE